MSFCSHSILGSERVVQTAKHFCIRCISTVPEIKVRENP